MQIRPNLKKSQVYFSTMLSKDSGNRSFILLSIFLLVVLLVSFIIPFLYFGRFMGTDDYTHLFHTNQMVSSRGISEFYENIRTFVDDPSSDMYLFNYPFGMWLFGATIAKITGLPAITADFIFIMLFLLILLGSFYIYSSVWLESREKKICAILFLISMPQISLSILSYTPTVFILPFLFMTLYFFLKDPVNWKLLPFVWLTLFIIIISHTGTFLFLFSFLTAFFLIFCLFWGKFLKPLYAVIVSTFVIYVLVLTWFPQIAYQYQIKSRMFFLPGSFLAKFDFPFLLDLTGIFYENLLVKHQFIYAVFLGAILFATGKVLIYIHRKAATFLSRNENFYAFTLPIQNISHSVFASPIWLGPVHVIFSLVGIFHLDNKGKCLLITALLTVLLPELIQTGVSGPTGALRQISYLLFIIPITATLGFWHILEYLHDRPSKIKTWLISVIWVVVCLVIIITPTLATLYYLPTISGENYVIGGMKWLGENGDLNEKVVGYTLRTVPIYTNMVDATYSLKMGTETLQFLNFLRSIFFLPGDQIKQVNDFRRSFGVKYILISDRVLDVFGKTQDDLTSNSNPSLNKIYASNDFGIYEISTSHENPVQVSYLADSISLKQKGGTYEIESDYYKVILRESNPVLERFGTSKQNLLGSGYFEEEFRIYGTESNTGGDLFNLKNMEFTQKIKDNTITYTTLLHNPNNQNPEGTFLVRYTFYPNVIKREFVVSNDWLVARYSQQMQVVYTIRIDSPMSQIVVKNEQTRLERFIYPSQDTVTQYLPINDFFLNNGKTGMYISFAAVSPQPSSVWYAGSTTNNGTTIGITQSNYLKPGASFLSTQFLSLGSESNAKKNIQNREGIELINYPNGIIPVMLSGIYRTPYSDNEKIKNGYALLNNYSIPYAEAINPYTRIENITDLQNVTAPRVISINLQDLLNNNVSIIGSQKIGSTYFDDRTTQETNIMVLNDYTKKQGVSYDGFMPDLLYYNLDTLTILARNKIPFIFSSEIYPPKKGYRNPQIANINSEPSGMVLFPVSYPTSVSLSPNSGKETIFSNWKAIIDVAADNDEMVLFLFRSQDIGDEAYTENFTELFSYAREKGLTFTSPDLITEHYIQLQNIRYSGFIEGDKASIEVINTNHVKVGNVTFKIILPQLTTGNYLINDGKIIRTKNEAGQSILYISTDIPGNSTKNIIIEPDVQRKSFVVEIPQQPIIAGSSIITVKDEEGNPLYDVDVIIDSDYYLTNIDGAVRVDLQRGYHTIIIQSPGFEKYSSEINVRGRVFIIEQMIGKFFDMDN